jgi:hypothetical protein
VSNSDSLGSWLLKEVKRNIRHGFSRAHFVSLVACLGVFLVLFPVPVALMGMVFPKTVSSIVLPLFILAVAVAGVVQYRVWHHLDPSLDDWDED